MLRQVLGEAVNLGHNPAAATAMHAERARRSDSPPKPRDDEPTLQCVRRRRHNLVRPGLMSPEGLAIDQNRPARPSQAHNKKDHGLSCLSRLIARGRRTTAFRTACLSVCNPWQMSKRPRAAEACAAPAKKGASCTGASCSAATAVVATAASADLTTIGGPSWAVNAKVGEEGRHEPSAVTSC